jgi:glutamate dehydrogenase
MPAIDRKDLERKLAAVARRWEDDLRDALVEAEGEARGLALDRRWSAAFPARTASACRCAPPCTTSARSSRSPEQRRWRWRCTGRWARRRRLGLKVYRLGAPVVLSDSLPMLEHMGVRVLAEDNHRIETRGRSAPSTCTTSRWRRSPPRRSSRRRWRACSRTPSRACSAARWRTTTSTGWCCWPGCRPKRSWCCAPMPSTCKQIGFAQSQATIAATLAAHPRIARMLVSLFRLRFDPQKHDDAGAASQVNALEQALDKVSNLSEDRVLRQLLALVQATLRTNFWRTGVGASGAPGRAAASSASSSIRKVPGLPEPRPLYEIFVYSPRFEGIHLRGGKVARGGLRWSDRPDDFRTEVLGLVKAQMVKNTVIVPVGSKGGFVLKKAPPASDREAFMKEGVACYQDYLRGLLDLTDNLVAARRCRRRRWCASTATIPTWWSRPTRARPPSPTTPTRSAPNTATGWATPSPPAAAGLRPQGDGHHGARRLGKRQAPLPRDGRRHASTDFTVAGVGDMSGDVFGNGMLLSRHIRLLAAFDHRHIFIDPAPDAAPRSPSASACSSCRARPGPTTTRS